MRRRSPIKGSFSRIGNATILPQNKNENSTLGKTQRIIRDCMCVSVCVFSNSIVSALCIPRDRGPLGSSVLGIFKERIIVQVAISSSNDPGIEPTPLAAPALAGSCLPLHHLGSLHKITMKIISNKMDNLKEINIF